VSDGKKPAIYGYMRAHDRMVDVEVMKLELQMFRWAQSEGYDLTVIYQEVEEGRIDVLTELVEELRLTGDRAVLVPSVEHFGTSRILQEHLCAYVVHYANAEVFELSDWCEAMNR
jgi:hypothetical protein